MTSTKTRRRVWGVSYCLLVLVATVAVVGPSDIAWQSDFVVGPTTRILTLGDHLQSTYYLWLWWHALATGAHFPWVDPFQFALTGHTTLQLTGWPLVLVSLPIQAIAGPVAAYNAVVLSAFVAAAGCMYLLVRKLGLPAIACAVSGFAYAFAPFRLIQGGHANSLLAFLLPLMLFFAENAIRGTDHAARWGWACVAAFLSLVVSGESHLAFYGAGLLAVYAGIRSLGVSRERLRPLLMPLLVLFVGTLLAVGVEYVYVLRPSGRGAIAINDAPYYAPRPTDLFKRSTPSERYAYPGAVATVLALIGVAVTLRDASKRIIGLTFAALTAIAYAMAMAPALPIAFRVYRHIPFVSFIRVPGRIIIIATLGIAVLAAFAIAALGRWRWRWPVTLLVLGAIAFDSTGGAKIFAQSRAGQDVLAAIPKGASVLDLPPFPPDQHGASRYMLDLTRHPGPRVNGYDVLAPASVRTAQMKVWTLTNVPPDPCDWGRVDMMFHFKYVAVHLDLFGPQPLWPSDGTRLVRTLDHLAGFRRVSSIEDVAVYELTPKDLACRR